MPFAFGAPLGPDYDMIGQRFLTYWYTNGSQIFTALSTHHIGTCVFSEPVYEALYFWLKKSLLLTFFNHQSDPLREEAIRDAFEGHQNARPYPASRLFGYPATGSFRSCFTTKSYWTKGLWCEVILHDKGRFFKMWFIIPFLYGASTFSTTLAYASSSRDGDDGVARWLYWTQFCQLGFLLYQLPYLLLGQRLILFRGMLKDVEKAKHLTSASVYTSRISRIKDFQFQSTAFITMFILLFTLFMPYGIAMQAYGVPRRSMWPSPLNFVFNQDGAAINLLGAPLHALVVKCVFTWVYVKWLVVYPEKPELQPQRATLKA